jgi:hypothetical protein
MVAHTPEPDTISLLRTGKDGYERVPASIPPAARTSLAIAGTMFISHSEQRKPQ